MFIAILKEQVGDLPSGTTVILTNEAGQWIANGNIPVDPSQVVFLGKDDNEATLCLVSHRQSLLDRILKSSGVAIVYRDGKFRRIAIEDKDFSMATEDSIPWGGADLLFVIEAMKEERFPFVCTEMGHEYANTGFGIRFKVSFVPHTLSQ